MTKNKGGSAFPVPLPSSGGGMTLRDYFAAKAMQGVLASAKEGDDFNERGCEWCYKVADDMLKAREQ
jgi:hypothetical protein